jgi:pleckstrin family protein A (phosphoinositide binding specific) protein 8
MSSSNDVPSPAKASNLFTRIPVFPDPIDGDIDTQSFLSAAAGVKTFVHALGPTLFSPVTSDIGGNIDKVTAILESDKEKYKTLSAIISSEKDMTGFRIGTDAILWLTRACEFISLFLTFWIQDHETGVHSVDLCAYFKNAYEVTLKKYHNWLVQKIVFVVLSGAPDRQQLMDTIFSLPGDDGHADGEDRKQQISKQEEDQLFDDIKHHVHKLQANMDCVRKMFDAVGFDWKNY